VKYSWVQKYLKNIPPYKNGLSMGMEFYGNSYKGNDEPIFVGIPTFLKLPWIRSHEELKSVRPDVAIIGEPFDFGTTIRPGA
jgi:agmatinase